MTRTQQIILIVAVIFGVVGGILWAIVTFTGGEEPIPVETNEISELPVAATNTTAPTTQPEEVEVESPTSNIPIDVQLKRLARNFTERYGSFSNQNDFENLENLEGFMTESFTKETNKFIAQRRDSEDPDAPYYGISTKVISVHTKEFNEEEGRMVVRLVTRRTETDVAAESTKTFDQDAELVFVKEGDRWLVNSFDFTNG